MKVELNVEGNQLENKIDKFLDNLNEDQIADITKELLRNSYENFRTNMLNPTIEAKMEDWKKENSDKVGWYQERDERKKLEADRTKILDIFFNQTKAVATAEAHRLISEDEGFQKVMEETVAEIKGNFKVYINNAIQQAVSQQLMNLFQANQINNSDIKDTNTALADIEQRLTNNNIF